MISGFFLNWLSIILWFWNYHIFKTSFLLFWCRLLKWYATLTLVHIWKYQNNFSIFQGLYAFIVYTILRNQLCRPTKGNYSLNNMSYDNSVMLLDNGHYPNHSTVLASSGQEKGSKVILTKAEHPPAIILHQKEHDVSMGIRHKIVCLSFLFCLFFSSIFLF